MSNRIRLLPFGGWGIGLGIGVIIALVVIGCDLSLIKLPGGSGSVGGDRQRIPLGADGGAGMEGAGQDSASPPAVPFWAEDWLWQAIAGLGLAATSALAARAKPAKKAASAARALQAVAKTIEPLRTGHHGGEPGVGDDIVTQLQSLIRTDPKAALALHEAVKRVT